MQIQDKFVLSPNFYSAGSPCAAEDIKIFSWSHGGLILLNDEYFGDPQDESLKDLAYDLRDTVENVARFFQNTFGLCGINGQGSLHSLMRPQD